MNQKLWWGLLTFSITLFGTAAHAENPEHMRQLLSTGDCPGCDLSETSLSGLDLPDANLQGANLSGTRFVNVQLTRANLESANLNGVSFLGTQLTGANLKGADLSNATSTFICSADFLGYRQDIDTCISQMLTIQILPELCSEVPEAIKTIALLENDVTDVCLEEDRVEAAMFSFYTTGSAQLSNSHLSLSGADLSGANLKDAGLMGADLSYATLTDVDAAGADLDYVRLMNADTAGLKSADLSNAWQSWQALGEWLIAAQRKAQNLSQQEGGRTNIEFIGYTQIEHHRETGQFSQSLSALNTGVPDENDAYRFGMVETGRPDMAYHYALSKTNSLASFLSVVLLEAGDDGKPVPTAHLCESQAAAIPLEGSAITPSQLPTVEYSDGFFNCPAGWKLLE